MTDLEKAARMALEALGYYEVAGLATTRVAKSITALRQALSDSVEQPAQQQKPVFPACKGMNCGCTDGVNHSLECQAEHAAAFAGGAFVPMSKQEPVAWNVIDPLGKVVATETNAIRGWARIGGYKPTVEGLLGFHEQGWRVVPAAPQPAQQCDDCNGMGIQDGKGDKCLLCDGHGEQPAQQQEWRGPVDWEEVAADYAKTIAMMKAEQEAAVLAEREACARVCENPDLLMNSTFQGVAEAIRARGRNIK